MRVCVLLLVFSFALICSTSARAIESGTSISGTIAVPEEEDSYTFSANAGDTVQISVGGSLLLRFNLLAPDGTNFRSSSATSRITSTNLPQSGTYTIVVTSYYNANSSATNTGSYTLHFVKGSGGSEYGPQQSGVTHEDTITVGDLDSFTMFASAGDSIQASAGGELALALALYAPDGTRIIQSGATGRLVSTGLPQTGNYTIVVQSYNNVFLSSQSTGAYTFHAVRGSGGSEYGPQQSGSTHSDTITKGDLDSFNITIQSGDSIQASAGGELLLHLSLYSPSGARVVQSGASGRLSATSLTEGGTYTLVVQAYSNVFSSSTIEGSYAVHIIRGSGGSEHGELISDTTISETITKGDLDSYSFTANAGEAIDLSVEGSLLVQLVLYDPTGARIRGSSANERIAVSSLPMSGTYTVVAYSYNNTFSSSGTTGTYQLSFELEGQVLSYAALGDSYSSGEGVFPFSGQYGIDWGPFEGCNRSARAYPTLVSVPGANAPLASDADAEFDFYACTGALTEHLQTGGSDRFGEPPQMSNGQIDQSRELITVTIGGNDAKFVWILAYCLAHNHCNDLKPFDPHSDLTLGELFPLWVAVVESRLLATYSEMKSKAPNATIIALSYPILMSGNECASAQLPGYEEASLSADEQVWMRQANMQVNDAIERVAARVGIHFVSVEDHFEQHGVCGEADDWIFGTWHVWPKGFFHPTGRGQLEYAKVVNAYLGTINTNWPAGYFASGLPRNPAPVAAPSGLTRTARSSSVLPEFDNLSVRPAGLSQACESLGETIIPSAGARVSGGGFDANEMVRLTLHAASGPIDLGTAQADINGSLDAVIDIPANLDGARDAVLEARGAGAEQQGINLIAIVRIRDGIELDSDEDGIPDSCDNCPNQANNNQLDLDFDGLGDACDVCPSEFLNDEDGDGLCQAVDPCPLDAANDADTDGVCEAQDNCPLVTNPMQENLDFDFQGNACDTDDDNDNLLDVHETGTGVYVSQTNTGTDPLKADSDEDGVDDATEIKNGTDPNGSGQLPQAPSELRIPLPVWAYLLIALGLLVVYVRATAPRERIRRAT